MKFRYFTRALLIVAVFLFSTVASKAQSNDELLNLLIKKNLLTQNEADSLRADLALKEQTKRDKENQHNISIGSRALQISGLVQTRYQGFEQSGVNNVFDLHRARLDVKGNITDKWSYELYTEFANTAKLLDAYTTYKVANFFKFQAGQFKIPLTYESLVSDAQLDFIDRSQVVEALTGRAKDVIGNQNGRDIGVQVSGSFAKLNEHYLFDYTFGIFNGVGYNVAVDNNNHKDIAARFGIHPIKGLDFGVGFYQGKDIPLATVKVPNPVPQARNRYSFDARYVSGAFSASAEYLHGTDGLVHKDGWYAQAGYFVLPKLQIVAKYDTYDPSNTITTDRSTIYYGGVNYVFNSWTKLAVDYLYKHEEVVQIKNNIIEAQLQISF